jgi:hypothetical protein
MKMKRKTMFCMLSLYLLSAASMNAQVTIGGATEPASGTLLDLNSPNGARGGLVLSNIEIDDVSQIPEKVLTGISESQDENPDLQGMMVYNTGTASVPAGIYIWNGYYWSTDGRCTLSVTTRTDNVIAFSSADLSVTADGCPPLIYTWYKTETPSNTGGQKIDTDDNASTYKISILEGNNYYYYCTVESPYSKEKVTSEVFTVTESPCSGAIVYNGAYNGPPLGTTTPNLVDTTSFQADWDSTGVFSPKDRDLCWEKNVRSVTEWTNVITYCDNLTTDGATNWRLPNLMELHVLYKALGGTGGKATEFANLDTNETGINYAANDMGNNFHWSSTETPYLPQETTGAAQGRTLYSFSFNNGWRTYNSPYHSGIPLRCVRD